MACKNIDTDRVFYYFNELCKIPHGSGNMNRIADFCVNFAKNHNLKYNRDSANNVIIYKPSENYPKDTIILQGHLDMVCQKDSDSDIDFLKDEITTFTDGDFLKANKTTLGADNGIAVAMIFAILESDEIKLPSIEAVLTTDEEIGMLGAMALDTSLLNGKKMITIDSEDDEVLTVSCAGGSDFSAILPIEYQTKTATEITVTLKGLKGGHSGVEIDKKRINANILAGRFLNYMKLRCNFDIISICGGDKSNAIANACTIRLCSTDADKFITLSHEYLNVIKSEISAREPKFNPTITLGAQGEFSAITSQNKNDIIASVLIFAFGLSAQIERELISERTKQGLAVARAKGKHIGRAKGKKSNYYKLTPYTKQIQKDIARGCSVSTMAEQYGVCWITMRDFCKTNIYNEPSQTRKK